MDDEIVNAVIQAMEIASPTFFAECDDVAVHDFIGELKLHGYKIVKEVER